MQPSVDAVTAHMMTTHVIRISFTCTPKDLRQAAQRTRRSAPWPKPPKVAEAPELKVRRYHGSIGTHWRDRDPSAKALNHTVERSIYL